MASFRDFMESALYDRKKGFYPNRETRGDFYTAPELHPVFAEILTNEICKHLKALAARHPKEPLFIVEMGSGDGTLARQILRNLKDSHAQWNKRARYVLVERVESLLLESILSLKSLAGNVLGYSRLEDVPPFVGVLFSNELIDAMPVHLLEKRGGKVGEVFVEADGETRVGELSKKELAAYAKAVQLSEGERHAVNLELRDWARQVSRLLKDGAVITIDYGKRFPAEAANPPRFFYRHTTGPQVTARPGAQDLTASVDFNSLMQEGTKQGLRTVSFTTLGQFLLDRGIIGFMPAGQTASDYQQRNRIKTLFHPDGMGDVFKVLIQEKMACC